MRNVQEVRALSEEDYGPFLQVLRVYEHEGAYYLSLNAGYGREQDNEERWYLLVGKPTLPTKESLEENGGLDPCCDQSGELPHLVGVAGKEVKTRPPS